MKGLIKGFSFSLILFIMAVFPYVGALKIMNMNISIIPKYFTVASLLIGCASLISLEIMTVKICFQKIMKKGE